MSNSLIHIIDSGNTLTKVATYKNDEIIQKDIIEDISDIKNFETGLFCSVNKELPETSKLINLEAHKHSLPFVSDYAETLGIDRFAISFYAQKTLNKKICLIDAGSFITLDFIDQGKHLGGYIYPGAENFLSLYFEKGEKLPLVTLAKPKKTIPSSTDQAISQAANSYLSAIIDLDNEYELIFTGGFGKNLYKIAERGCYKENYLFDALYWIYTNYFTSTDL